MGLRSEEVRRLPRHGSLQLARSDARPWLVVLGKGGRLMTRTRTLTVC